VGLGLRLRDFDEIVDGKPRRLGEQGGSDRNVVVLRKPGDQPGRRVVDRRQLKSELHQGTLLELPDQPVEHVVEHRDVLGLIGLGVAKNSAVTRRSMSTRLSCELP
jgi:hypothetical protein